MEEGGVLLAAAGKYNAVTKILGKLRIETAKTLSLIPKGRFAFTWVNEFPFFEWDEERGSLSPSHHFFSMPREEDIPLLETDPLKVRAHLYDLVCNGVELASGSIRIHNRDLQERVLEAGGVPREKAKERFGFLLDALEYGAPPHGGIAPGRRPDRDDPRGVRLDSRRDRVSEDAEGDVAHGRRPVAGRPRTASGAGDRNPERRVRQRRASPGPRVQARGHAAA